jgi:hypothetical protein
LADHSNAWCCHLLFFPFYYIITTHTKTNPPLSSQKNQMPRKLELSAATDETRLSTIRGIGGTALQKLAASGLVKDYSPKITLGEMRSLGLTYKQLLSKNIRGVTWKNMLGEEPGHSAPPKQREPKSQGMQKADPPTDNMQDIVQPEVNPLLPPAAPNNPTGDPQLETRPDETPEVLATVDQPDGAGAKAVPTGMLAGGQASMNVIPDVQLNISPGDATIVAVAQPAVEPFHPIAPAAALGPQQGIVGARQVDPQTHEQVVTQQALGQTEPPTSKADGSGDIGDDGKGSLSLENEEQKRFKNARRGFRAVPMDLGGGGGSKPPGLAPGQPKPPGFPGGQQAGQQQQSQPQDEQEMQDPYRQRSLFRNFDSSIVNSKRIRTRAAALQAQDSAYALAVLAQQDPSYQTWNPMTQGVWGWAEPLTTANNFLDRSSMITTLQYQGAQGLMNVYDPAPILVGAMGGGDMAAF